MSVKRIPHDQFFKRMMTDISIAMDFFIAHLPPAILSQVQLDTLRVEPGSFVDDELKSRLNDMLYKVQLYNNRTGYLYLLVEHSSSPDPLMAFRLTYYLMQVLDKHVREAKGKGKSVLPLPLIWPTVFYNGKECYQGERCLFKLFGEHEAAATGIWTEPFHLIDVSLEADLHLRGQRWASILSWCMRHSSQKKFLSHLAEFGELIRDTAVQVGDKRLKAMLYYIASSLDSSEDSDIVLKALLDKLPSVLEGDIMTLGEQLYSRGKVEGKQEAVDATFKAIMLIRQQYDDHTIAAETQLDLVVISRLRQELPH